MGVKRSLHFLLFKLLFGLSLSCGAESLEPVLRETWADGDRTVQELPGSAAWLSSEDESTLTAIPVAMRQELRGSAMVTAYFTRPGSRVELGAGDSDGNVFDVGPYGDRSATSHFAFDTVGLISSGNNGESFTLHSVEISASSAAVHAAAETASRGETVPEVAPADLEEIPLDLFSDADLRPGWMARPMPYYLAHIAELANSVVTHGESRGWINRRVWRGASEFAEQDPRVMENVLSFIYFYTLDEPWNPYYGDPALRKRLELALAFYLSRLGENGLMKPRTPDQHVGFRLATTMFFTKFMGEALVLLRDGPPIDSDLHGELLDAQRRALKYVFTSDLAGLQGRQFSNQYGNVFGGAYAYLYLEEDAEIKALFERALKTVVPEFQSPAGYLYENHSVDFGYGLGTHHSNVHIAWHYANLVGMDTKWLEEETALYAEWLSYNTVPSPDFSYFFINRAIEARQNRPGFDRANAPFARDVPALRPFVSSQEEVREADAARRADLAASWPEVQPLGTGFSRFSPYAFLHRDHFEWYPSEAERADARQDLPYLASERFTHQRVDDRRRMEVTFIRRPGYYAVFNAGEEMSAVQTFGLGLLWHPEAGAAIQSQTRMPEAAWGVVLDGDERPVENTALEVRYFLDGREIYPRTGAHDLDEGVFEIHYRLRDRNEKFLRFEDDRIVVAVNPGNGFTEQIPVLLDPDREPVVTSDGIRIPRGHREIVISPEGQNDQSIAMTDRRFGNSQVAVVHLEGFRRFTYSLKFE